MPTEYGNLAYWNERFAQNQENFEWLKTSDDFMPHVRAVADSKPQDDRLILHIGPGSSNLSLELRQLVHRPQQVHNVDFSAEAVLIGQKMEDASAQAAKRSSGVEADDGHRMLWTQADLLNIYDIHKLLQKNVDHKLYNLIIDKSTSDSIACCSDVEYDPVTLTPSSTASVTTSASQSNTNLKQTGTTKKIMPVNLLALHMAAVTAPGGYWLVLSYSDSRFELLDKPNPFRPQSKHLSPEELNPADYWTMESKREIERPEVAEMTDEQKYIVYRPIMVDWLYLLRRNGRPLEINYLK